MEWPKKILTNGLLIFALISIGFILGKHSTKHTLQVTNQPNRKSRQVAVYYLHATFRCVTCNSIEKKTRELLDSPT